MPFIGTELSRRNPPRSPRSYAALAETEVANILTIIEEIRDTGLADLRGIAAAFNARGVRTARGGQRHVSNVKICSSRLLRGGKTPLLHRRGDPTKVVCTAPQDAASVASILRPDRLDHLAIGAFDRLRPDIFDSVASRFLGGVAE
jgi:hypothetical protein